MSEILSILRAEWNAKQNSEDNGTSEALNETKDLDSFKDKLRDSILAIMKDTYNKDGR